MLTGMRITHGLTEFARITHGLTELPMDSQNYPWTHRIANGLTELPMDSQNLPELAPLYLSFM